MRIIKKLDIFILKGYLQLFAGTFFICLFIFLMQFVWKFIDDLVGKGLTWDVLAKFFWYCSLTEPYALYDYVYRGGLVNPSCCFVLPRS